MDIEEKATKWWDGLGKFLTFLIVAIYLINILNGIFNFIPAGSIWVDIVANAMFYGPMALVIVTSLEVVDGKKGLIRTALLLCWIAIILFSISPNLFGLIK
jgi:hypothetical protein